MGSYVCGNCGFRVEIKQLEAELFCPKCSSKILFKETPSVAKEVKAD